MASATPALAAQWTEAESRHFRIIGSGDQAELGKFAQRLEAFHNLLRLATGANESNKPIVKVKVFIVPTMGDVQRLYGPGGDGVGGFYFPDNDGAYAVVPRSTGDGTFTGQLVLFHEYAHHYMLQYTPAAYPSWYVEGFAEIAATASFERKGSITFGKAAQHRQYELVNGLSYPAAKMIDGTYIDDQKKGRGWSYGDAWVLSHYLTFGDKRHGQFRGYLEALNAGQKPAAAAAVFGNLNDLQREVSAYLQGGSFAYRVVPIPLDGEMPVQFRPLSPAEAQLLDMQVELHRIVSLPDKDDKPDSMTQAEFDSKLAKATKDRDAWLAKLDAVANRLSNEPAAWLLLADARCEAEQFVACAAAADRADKIAPSQRGLVREAEAMIGLAKDLTGAERTKRIEQAQAMLLKANAANPNDPLALIWYYRSFGAMGASANADGLLALGLAVDLVPQLSGPRLTLAREYIARKRYAEARAALLPLANSPHDQSAASLARKLLEEIDAASPAH